MAFTIKEFAKFCDAQPRGRIFSYMNSRACPVAEFARKKLGMVDMEGASAWSQLTDRGLNKSPANTADLLVCNVAETGPSTYGRLTARLFEYLAERT